MAFKLWSSIFKMFGVQWVLPEMVLDLLCGWQCHGPNSDVWNLIPLCLMQTIWREQNRHIFEDMDFTSSQIQASFINSLYKWSFISGLTNNNFIHSFKESAHMQILSYCNSLGYFMFIFMMQPLFNNIIITYQKKKQSDTFGQFFFFFFQLPSLKDQNLPSSMNLHTSSMCFLDIDLTICL